MSVPVTTNANQASFTLNLPKNTLEQLVQNNVRQFTLTSNQISITLDAKALQFLNTKCTGGEIMIRVTKQAPSTTYSQSAIGNRPFYDIQMFHNWNGQQTEIKDFNGGKLTFQLSYTPVAGENVNLLRAVFVDDNGNVEWITESRYDATAKAVVWESGHLSKYGIGYNPTNLVKLDTSSVNVKGGYSFLVKGNNDISNIRVEVTNPEVASVSLENPNDSRGAKYRITAKSLGSTDVRVIYKGEITTIQAMVDVFSNSLVLDTVNYVMAPGNQYTIGAFIKDSNGNSLGNEQVKTMINNGKLKVRDSRTGSIVDRAQLENGNFQVTGKNEGTAYIIYEVGGTHASVRIDVQKGVRQHGTSVRNMSYYMS